MLQEEKHRREDIVHHFCHRCQSTSLFRSRAAVRLNLLHTEAKDLMARNNWIAILVDIMPLIQILRNRTASIAKYKVQLLQPKPVQIHRSACYLHR
jgi:hypothetical protein